MSRVDEYRLKLKELQDWTPFLLKNSGLPGPRGNLELAEAVAEQASRTQVEQFLSIPFERAPGNSAQVFLVICGVTALGKMAARGEPAQLPRLRAFASDTRWRIREAVAIALQYFGDADMPSLLKEMAKWSGGNWYEKRAAAAALAEPRLLKEPAVASQVLRIFDRITEDMATEKAPRDESFKVLRQSMGYCWSVAASSLPAEGKATMEKWLPSTNPDVRWVMKENLKKNRLLRMDARWTENWRRKLGK